jgi:hypothetical protein
LSCAAAGEAQLKGVYARHITDLSPETFGETFSRIIGFFYDYGPVTVTRSRDERSLQMKRAQMPLAVIEWWSLVSIPFLRVPLQKNGVDTVDITPSSVITDAHAPVPLGTAVWDVRFR